MKNTNIILFTFITLYFCNSAFAINPKISAYNDTMYCLVDPKHAKNGELTAQSDTYFFYNLETLDLDITWTEWLADGSGGEYIAPYSPTTIHYQNVTLKDIAKNPDLVSFYEGTSTFLPSLQKQASEYFSQILKENYVFITSAKTRNLFYSNINQIDNRLLEPYHSDLTVWATESYNWFKQNSYSDFTSSAFGLHIGMDKYIKNNLLLGFSYSFSDGETTYKNNLTQDDSIHNIYLYSMYNFNNVYLSLLFNYGFSQYKNIDNFSASNFGTVINMGYKTPQNIIAETGLRYLNLLPVSYKDSIGNETSFDSNNFLTWTTGLKYTLNLNPFSIKINFNILYDILYDNDEITVYYNAHDIFANTAFKSWDPFGIETGLSAQTTFDNGISLSIDYLLSARKDFLSQTAFLHAKYKF